MAGRKKAAIGSMGKGRAVVMKLDNGIKLDAARVCQLREFKEQINGLALGRVSSVSAADRIAAAAESQLLKEWGINKTRSGSR